MFGIPKVRCTYTDNKAVLNVKQPATINYSDVIKWVPERASVMQHVQKNIPILSTA
jgi:hypothetical protein